MRASRTSIFLIFLSARCVWVVCLGMLVRTFTAQLLHFVIFLLRFTAVLHLRALSCEVYHSDTFFFFFFAAL